MNTKEISFASWRTRHNRFGIVNAIPKILDGEIIEFNSYKRNPTDSTILNHAEQVFIGLEDPPEERKKDGYGKALRISPTKDLGASGSYSLIPSWEPDNSINPLHIACAITYYFRSCDVFVKIDNEGQ